MFDAHYSRLGDSSCPRLKNEVINILVVVLSPHPTHRPAKEKHDVDSETAGSKKPSTGMKRKQMWGSLR